MLHIQRIETLDLPELAPYRTMRRQEDHRQQQIFVAEGEKVVRRLIESKFTVVSVLLPEKWLAKYRLLLEGRRETVHAFIAEKKLLEQLTGFSMYQGVLAVGKIPPMPSLDLVLKTSPQPRLLVAVDALSNAENLGGLVRNCVAFGVQTLLVGETSSSPYLRRAVRASMGAILVLPVIETRSLVQSLHQLRESGVRCVAAHPHTDQRALARADFRSDCCIVFGSEGCGISQPVLDVCDEAVAIPMHAEVDSLNVGSAAAIFLYEISRQRANR